MRTVSAHTGSGFYQHRTGISSMTTRARVLHRLFDVSRL
jgi:hypothetical protein